MISHRIDTDYAHLHDVCDFFKSHHLVMMIFLVFIFFFSVCVRSGNSLEK